MTIAAGDVYEVALKQLYGGSTIMNVLHVELKQALAGAQASFQTFADDAKEMLRVKQAAALTYVDWKATQVAGAGIVYDTVTCRRSGGDFYEGNFTGTLTGADTSGAAGPSFQAAVMALKTGRAGRSFRGQVYIGGLDANALDSANRNNLIAAYRTAWTTAIATFTAKYLYPAGTSADFNWVVFSRLVASGCKYVNALPRARLTHVQAGNQPGSSTHITTAVLRTPIAPMNRRKIGVGI